MGASKSRRERRKALQAQKQAAPVVLEPAETPRAAAAPVLRLVRSEGERLSPEPDATGRSGPTVGAVHQENRSGEICAQPAGGSGVVAEAATEPPRGLVDAIPVSLVRRTFDAAEINPILNDPSVFRFAAAQGDQALNIAPVLADERNVVLMADRGYVLFHWQAPGVYQVHTNFLKATRKYSGPGTYVLNACRAAYRWMFTQTDCVTLFTWIPAHNRAAAMFAPLGGWTKEYDRKAVWPSVSDGLVDMAFCALRYADWVRKTPELMLAGRAFHEHIQREFARLGKPDEAHADEDCHDLHVGACVEMIHGGQMDKAIALYDHFAQYLGFHLISIVTHEPPVLNIGNALLKIEGDAFKVLKVF